MSDENEKPISDADRAVAEWVTNFAKLLAGESETCLRCGGHIDSLKQVGRCVYAEPCGCRQYQGKVPEKWRNGS